MEESTQIQVVPPAFTGASREVDPGACFEWLRQGWLLFIANPGTWIGSAVLMMVIVLGVQIVPVFGQIAVSVLLPVFAGGLLLLSRHQHADGNAEIADLFAGFHHNAGGLVMIGVYFATGIFGIAFLAFMLVSGGVLGGVITGRIAGFGIALGGVMIASLLAFILSQNGVIGLFQGAAETGPRALGHRSILANPCNPLTRENINLSVKAKDQAEQSDAMQKLASEGGSAQSGTTNLGALLKAKLNSSQN